MQLEISKGKSEICQEREVCGDKHPKLEEDKSSTEGGLVDRSDGM